MITNYTAYPFWEDADASLRDRLESVMCSSEQEGKWSLSPAIGIVLEDEELYGILLADFCRDADEAIKKEEVDTDDPYALADYIDDAVWDYVCCICGLPH